MTTPNPRWRDETRGVKNVAHLNNCGAGLAPAPVADAVVDHLRLEEHIGAYEAAAINAEKAQGLYSSAASLIGCDPSEIAFCDSATRAWNTFVYSLKLKPDDVIVTSRIEFGSGLIALQHIAERSGAVVKIAPHDVHGRVQLAELPKLFDKPPALVAVTHAAAHSGAVNDVAEIGKIAKASGSIYLVDCCQSMGQMPVNIAEIGCDALTVTGRKWLRGPRGTGFLYVRDEIAQTIDPVTSDLVTADYLIEVPAGSVSRLQFRNDSRRFEVWERSIAGTIGLSEAMTYYQAVGVLEARRNILRLAQHARDGLAEIHGTQTWAPDQVESGVVGFQLANVEPSQIKAECLAAGINISTMADWDAPLDFHARHSSSVARVAPHYYNTEEEVDAFLDVARSLAR